MQQMIMPLKAAFIDKNRIIASVSFSHIFCVISYFNLRLSAFSNATKRDRRNFTLQFHPSGRLIRCLEKIIMDLTKSGFAKVLIL